MIRIGAKGQLQSGYICSLSPVFVLISLVKLIRRLNKKMAPKKDHWLVEFVKTIVSALVLVLIVHSLLFKPFVIPSPSMVPTFLVGDYLFVSKFPYGYSQYSFPLSPNLFSGRVWAAQPK